MSTPNPLLIAPPIPKSLELDYHTYRFFHPDERSVPVAAMFRLENGGFEDMVFIGGVASFNCFGLHLVIQEFTGDPVVDAKSPVLVSSMRLPFYAIDPEKVARLTKDYFANSLTYPDAQDARYWWDLVPTLGESEPTASFARLHFDAKSEMGLQITCDTIWIVNLWREDVIYLDISTEDLFFGRKWWWNPGYAFTAMKTATFHSKVRALLRNEESALGSNFRFYMQGQRDRYREVFGCKEAAVERTVQMLTLALTMEMGEGGSLRSEGWTWIKWQPWSEEEMFEGMDENGDEWEDVVPDALYKWLRFLCEKTGCHISRKVTWDEEGTQVFARAWAGDFEAEVTRPSAHEFLEAGIKLREMLERG